jgi:hypothetical protein
MEARMNKAVWTAAALALACSLPASAQEEMCTGIPAAYISRCITAVQGADAAAPQLGLLVAGGSPGLGIGGPASGPGLRTSLRANLVRLALPNFITENNPQTAPPTNTEELRAFGVVLTADASFRVMPAVDLLASASFLPLDLLGRETFNPSSSQLAFGAGVRATVLRESAGMPGVALSAMYRRAGNIQIGTACEGAERPESGNTNPPTTLCDVTGDVSQATVEVAGISTRALVSKGVGGFGLGLGLGYDLYDGDFHVDLLGAPGSVASPTRVYHTPTGALSSGRFSAFLNASRGIPGGLGAVVAEVGWMQGGDRVDGFTEESDYDPGRGTIFGSFGGRFGIGSVAPAPGVQGQPPVPGARTAPRAPVPRRRDVITKEEMVEAGVTNLYEAVQRLRPEWLRGANVSNITAGGQDLVVYQNQTPLGSVEELRELTPEYTESLRFLDGPTASNTLPGLGSRRVAGAIVVVTRGAARN